MSIQIRMNSHISEVEAAENSAVTRAMEAVSLQMEGYAKEIITAKDIFDTGRLRNSISHAVNDHTAIVGTNVEYAPYHEFGTSKMKARPYLRPTVQEHLDEYKEIIKAYLQA